MSSRTERILVHGPCLQDLTDLLYFDKIAYPVTNALVRPDDLAPGYVGYPAQQPVPEPVRERLGEAGLLVVPSVMLVPSAEEMTASLAGGAEGLFEQLTAMSTDTGRFLGGQVLSNPLRLPARAAHVQAWLQGFDAKVRELADYATSRGRRATPKLHVHDADATLGAGWDRVLGVTFEGMPCLVPGRAGLDETIAFLGDQTLRAKRAALFDWPLGPEVGSAARTLPAREIPELIEAALREFLECLRGAGLLSGARTFELLVALDRARLDSLALPTPTGGRQGFRLSARGLDLADAPPADGRELAYVSHATRDWRSWFPMVG